MLLPATSVYRFDAVVHAIDAQFISSHADDAAVFEMRRICDCIVAFAVALIGNPEITEYGN